MKTWIYCGIMGCLGLLCMGGQVPRKEVVQVVAEKAAVEVEKKEEPIVEKQGWKSAAKKSMEEVSVSETRKGAAKKVVESQR